MDGLAASEYYSRKFVTKLIKYIELEEEKKCSSTSVNAKIDCSSQENAASTSSFTKSVSSTKTTLSRTMTTPIKRRIPKLKITSDMLNRGEKRTIQPEDESDEDPTDDYQQVRHALYHDYEEEEKRRGRQSSLQPLSELIIKKDYFPNFVDPVPPNHQYIFPPKPVVPPISEVPIVPEVESKQEKQEEMSPLVELDAKGKVVLDNISSSMLNFFFDDMCPDAIFKPRGCHDRKCMHRTHEMPGVDHLEPFLQKCNLGEAGEVYKLVAIKFPQKYRDQFLDMFIEFFIKKKSLKPLKKLISDYQKSSPTLSFVPLVEGMTKSGWSAGDAIQFIIDNHEQSDQAQIAILEVIGSTGEEVIKFADYLEEYVKGLERPKKTVCSL